jgi:hypothetical protein
MKRKYPQNSPENFDETSSNEVDMTLVNFLQQNKPIAPLPAPNFEQQLFAEIGKYPQRSTNRHFKRWLPWALAVPVVLVTGLGFNLANNRSQLQIASNAISEADQSAIEQSLINSWRGNDVTVAQSTAQSTNNATASTDTQLLMELSPFEYE